MDIPRSDALKTAYFFTESQVYFKYQAVRCDEAMSLPSEIPFSANNQRLCPEFRSGLFQLVERDIDPWEVWETIKAYAKRSITYDVDSLNGILGMLVFYESPENPIRHFWGVPIFPPTS